MVVASEQRIQAPGVRSLVWEGDTLVDWIGGGARYDLDGGCARPSVYYAYAFDAAVALAGSGFAVIYTRSATKGLVLHHGSVVREINRSFYHADVYEYPIALSRLASGREVLVHCPEDYCRLEIEDLATGERLTRSNSRQPSDIFHSRLSVSPDGRFLASAGWLWHPLDSVALYDLERAISDPAHLDGSGLGLEAMAEESSATFFPDGRLAVALRGGIDEDESNPLKELRIYGAGGSVTPLHVLRAGRLGSLAAIGRDHLLALYEHPRLIDAHTGREVLRWPELRSGTQTSAILPKDPVVPPVAVDPERRRFAIADAEGITVIRIDEDDCDPRENLHAQ